MIKILSGHSLTPAGEILAESMAVREKERDSTATITEEMNGETRATGTWIMDGQGRVWRISSVEENPVTRTRTINLESMLQTLGDRIIPEETEMDGTAENAIRRILAYQSDWILGGCDYADANPYSFDAEDLKSALETVLSSLSDSWLETDVTRYPFVMRVRRGSWTPTCEMRMDRNIQTMRRTVDTSGMFTRFWPIGKEDLRIGYISRNEDLYGIREKSMTDQSRETAEELQAWAREQLERHARPTVSITIGGLELSQATGESLDRLTVGTVCRVPLPEYGTVIEERIIQKHYPDILNRPEEVTITLGNEIMDVARIIRQEVTSSSSTAARGARAGSKKAAEDHAWFTDTDDHVSMTAEAIIGKDESGKVNWSRVADLTVDGNGIHGRVVETENELITHESRIEATERSIELEVRERTKEGAELRSSITVEAGKIRSEVTDVTNELRSSITQERDRISLVVEGTGSNARIRPASIVASINESESNILIDADKVRLSGTTTINDIITVQNSYMHINAPLMVSNGDGGSPMMYVGGTLYVNRVAANSVEVPYHLSSRRALNVADATVSGNTLTITYVNGDQATFNKVASLSGGWSGNTYTVSASPAGILEPVSTELLSLQGIGAPDVTGKLVSQYMNVMIRGSGSTPVASGAQLLAVLDASEVYDAAHDAGLEDATVSTYSRGWDDYSGQLPSSRAITIRGRNDYNYSRWDDVTVSLRLYKSGNTVYLQHNDGGWNSVAMISTT